ncbi:MAG: primosomal protein N' [Patescibacteria group bacterium]|nr:primosomal protein N' [Patescibacteria group bacterium]
MQYAEILLNQKYSSIKESFTYEIPEEVEVGSLVIVPYKKLKLGGIVLKKVKKPAFKTREILKTNEIYPKMPSWQMETARFISDHYICNLYKAFKLFLPNKIWNLKGKNEIPEIKEAFKKPHLTLTKAQKDALKAIEKSQKHLIHGVTGSGKTEIYLQLAYKLAKEGKQTLILVPEISLTPQLTNYFEKVFGKSLAVIHSQLTELQKSKQWLKIASNQAKVVIGSRSSLFSPFKDLGAIIMDEEHDLSYKQDQSPRYHARAAAEKITDLVNCKLILASATPGIETYHKAKTGELNLIELPQRIGETPMPEVEIIDMREELKARNFGILSDKLTEALEKTLEEGKQAILFLNRRGTSSSITCRECGFTPECPNCSVRMTHHHSCLLCHHCSHKTPTLTTCPNCQSIYIKTIGIGTERVEQEICATFPKAKVLRADRDTVKTRHDFPEIYKKFHSGEKNILIGTQMIGKGLDIENVDLVAVILADIGLHVPDFRAQEFAFQTLTQVSGRAGRRSKQGKVIIQTYMPDNFAIQSVKTHAYEDFYKKEIETREKFNLPPFYKIIKLTYTDPDFEKSKLKVLAATKKLEADNLEITHAPALISKKHGKYHYNLFLKAKSLDAYLEKVKNLATEDENWKIDIDPLITI